MSVRCKFKVTQLAYSEGTRQVRDANNDPIPGRLDRTPDGLGHVFVEDAKGQYRKSEPCRMATITMAPVSANNDPKHENSKFWNSSPGGEFKLNCVNEAAVAQLELGKEYYLDITPA